MLEQLGRESPNNIGYRLQLADTHRLEGQDYLRQSAPGGETRRSNLQRAQEHIERSRALLTELAAQSLLPKDWALAPGQLTVELEACEAAIAKM
jgi:hypothetical protein